VSSSAPAATRWAASAPHLAPVPAQTVDAGEFRQALGRHPAGVAIVTLAGPAGLTVTSFSSASLDPPLVSFYIGHGSSNWPAVQQARHFAVNLMGHNHQDTAAQVKALPKAGCERIFEEKASGDRSDRPQLHD